MEHRRPKRERGPEQLKRESLKREYRYVTPAVRLERKHISMLNPPPPGQQQQQQQQQQTTQGPARSSPARDTGSPSDETPGSTSDDAPGSTPRFTAIVGEKGSLEEERGSSSVVAPPPNGHRLHHQEEPLKHHPSKQPQRPQEHHVTQPEKEIPKIIRTAEEGDGTIIVQEQIQATEEEEEQEEEEEEEATEEEDVTKATQELTKEKLDGEGKPPELQTLPAITTEREDAKDELNRLATAAAASRLAVQSAHRPPKQESAQVMEFFEQQDLSEHEHSLDEVSHPSLLVVPPVHHGSFHQRGQRSPSPSSLHASVGLSHLDNLIRLMEQLSTLRDENLKLRKKCDYLETTKKLLQARSELHAADPQAAGEYMSLPVKHKHKSHHHHHHHHHRSRHEAGSEHGPKVVRPRLPSAEDVECLEISESASDHRPKRSKGALHKRSFSTGSLEVEILDETSAAHGREGLIPKSKSGKSVFGTKSPSSKQKSKSSKWARVKKVLTGQKLYEDLGTTIRSLKELGRSTQRYSSVSTSQDFSPPPQRVSDHRSVDSGVSTSLDADTAASRLLRTSSSSAEASSAGRSPNHTGEGGGVEELGTEIWMGPPGWWEQYEARKHSEASNSSDVSSVIEVKTMYLGSKQKDTERLLKVKPLIRRQSSPSLITKDAEGQEDEEEDEEAQRHVHRSASYKGEDLDIPKEIGAVVAASGKSEKDSKKLHQKAWGRVKEMIHVRKDSVKKRRRDKGGGDEWSQGEEISEGDIEGLLEEHLSAEFGEGIMSRSTPKTSPMVVPRQSTSSKSFSESPPQSSLDPSSPSFRAMAASAGSAEMAAMLAGSVSEEFTQKMLEWQALQLRKSSSFKITSAEAEGEGSCVDGTADSQELLSTSQTQEPDKTGRARATSLGQQGFESTTEGTTSEITPLELLGPSVNVEELQRRISESFSRKLAEWERRKYRRPTTPEMEHKGSRSRKDKDEQRMRSKKSREEKERERQEKAREREMQKVEKEQVKLEKERVRIEKERIRAMERQAKLERMKGRLSQFDTDSTQPPSSPAPTSANPAQDAAALQKVTSDFQRKLEEWEVMKGLSVQDSGATSSEGPSPQPSSALPQFTLGPPSGQERPPPLSLQPCLDSPEERSPVDRTSDVSLGDDSTSVTEENLTKTNITSLERANSQLLQEVQRKEQEYSALQEDVQKLNSKLEKVRQEHASEMARFKRELEAGEVSGPVQVDVSDLEQTMRELEERIVMMETAGDQLAESMESAAIGKWQSIEGEEAVSGQLVDMVEQMKSMLVQASQTRESTNIPPTSPTPTTATTGQEKQSEKSLALHNFEQVYSHAMKLQVQMNNLRVSQLERNKEIMLIKRQLLLQEVNNVLLQAHITRRETELYQYREARRHANVRRWNTFSTSDNRVPLGPGDARPPLLRNVSLQEGDQPQQQAASGAKHSAKHDDIPFITDEAVSIPAAGVGPEPVVTKEGATVTKPTTTTTTASSATTTTTATTTKPSELATDHMEQHMASPIAETTTTEEKKTGAATPASGAATSATVAAGPSMAATSPTPADTAKQTKTSTSEASKVETGSPTLLAQTTANGSAKVPADTAEPPPATTKTETPDLPDIPKGPDTGEEPTLPSQSAPQVDDNYSPTESVMECTKSAVDRDTDGAQGTGTGPEAAVGGVDISSREQQQTQPKAVRSPVSKAKYLRRQKEEREKHKEKKAASPKSPHRDSASGKPPLPRPSTPHSPGSSQRSKSVGDMDGIEPNCANAEPPLKQVIERFEKRATVCETEERKIEFRKTPSPTLHLPRVGLVSRVRRLKPAAELLEESQRYRSGHSIYATRIMHRYLPAQAAKLPGSGTGTPTPAASSTPAGSSQDKENISGTSYVQAIVKRLSREGTPVKSAGSSSTNSSLSLQRTDSPRAHSEFVAHLVHKLSSSSGPETHHPSSSSHSPSMPLKDLTNDGHVKKLAQVFSEEHRAHPDQTLSESDLGAPGRTSGAEGSPSRLRASVSGAPAQPELKPDSTISPASHASMPTLAFEQGAMPEEAARERAATYCVSEADRPRQHQQQHEAAAAAAASAESGGSIEHIAEEFLDPALLMEGKGQKISPSSSTKSKNVLCCQSSACNKAKSNNHKSETAGSKLPSSPKSQERRGAREKSEKMETIGVLCKQSMSFDLGVSLRAQSPETAPRRQAEDAGESSTSPQGGAKARPSSTSSEGDAASSSADDKKKSRTRFLDSSWLQKPKKFFKVSK